MCNDYRAALGPDMADDAADHAAHASCPTLSLYGAEGAMARMMYDMHGSGREMHR